MATNRVSFHLDIVGNDEHSRTIHFSGHIDGAGVVTEVFKKAQALVEESGIKIPPGQVTFIKDYKYLEEGNETKS